MHSVALLDSSTMLVATQASHVNKYVALDATQHCVRAPCSIAAYNTLLYAHTALLHCSTVRHSCTHSRLDPKMLACPDCTRHDPSPRWRVDPPPPPQAASRLARTQRSGSFLAGPSPLHRTRQVFATGPIPTPQQRAPVGGMRGVPAVVRARLLRDKHRALVEDSEGVVSCWDLVYGVCVEEYGKVDFRYDGAWVCGGMCLRSGVFLGWVGDCDVLCVCVSSGACVARAMAEEQQQ